MDKDLMVGYLKIQVRAMEEWAAAIRVEGYIPTIELFIERLKEHINKCEN